MGMDLYKRTIDSVRPSDCNTCRYPVEYTQYQRYIAVGFPEYLFSTTYELKPEFIDELIKEHGDMTEYDFSDVTSLETSFIQFADSYLVEVTADDLTCTDTDGNLLMRMLCYTSDEILYARKPFRHESTPSSQDGGNITIYINNMGGISDNDSAWIYNTLREHDNVFFSSDNEVYLKLTKFFNGNCVPGGFFNPISPGEFIDFCY
jgi:hypothetical protein